MKTCHPGGLMMLVAVAACPAVAHAEEDHGENAKKHLEQAVESGSKGCYRSGGESLLAFTGKE